jgi:hypothetical protein
MYYTKLKHDLLKNVIEGISFILFLFVMLSVYKIKIMKINEDPFVLDLIENWSKKGVKEIYKTDLAEKCEHPFFQREWEGVEKSCDCRSSYIYGVKTDIFSGSCSFLSTLAGCGTLPKIYPQIVTKWKSSQLCLKYLNSDFHDTITIIGDKCPKNYIICGTDSSSFNLCFAKAHGCPLNRVKISPLGSKISDQYSGKLALNEDWQLQYSNRHTNNSILIDVKYTEGRMCLNPDEVNLKLNYLKFKKPHINFDVINQSPNSVHPICKTKFGKINFDERYQVLDSVSKFKFYSDNGIMNNIEQLPNINNQELINYNSFLYERSYIHWSPYCRQDSKLSPKAMIKDLADLTMVDELFNFIRGFFLFISLKFLIIDLTSYFLLTKLKTELRTKIAKISKISSLIFVATFICLLTLFLLILENYLPLVDKFLSQKCGEYTTNMIFTNIANDLSELTLSGYRILIFSIILLFFLLVKVIIRKK